MRFTSLGSGSKGNATVIEAGQTRLVLDCGFSVVELEKRLALRELSAQAISAIVVTHEHTDHIGGVARLSRKHRLPVWLTAGTLAACRDQNFHHYEIFHAHEAFCIGDLELHPFPVPHDAREPCQFVFSDGRSRLGILTDTGAITPHIEQSLSQCDALLLECNYDPDLLQGGPYPWQLKQRVASRLGHLANEQAQQLLERIDTTRLQHLIGMHVSEKNNTEALAMQALCRGLQCSEPWIAIAAQDQGFDWKSLG